MLNLPAGRGVRETGKRWVGFVTKIAQDTHTRWRQMSANIVQKDWEDRELTEIVQLNILQVRGGGNPGVTVRVPVNRKGHGERCDRLMKYSRADYVVLK